MHQPAIAAIAELPARMRDAVSGLSDAQADMPYRPGGWTVRQLVHHVADSHANGYIRLKLGLTEEQPTILQMYAWHARHHVAHITSLRQREGWLAKP